MCETAKQRKTNRRDQRSEKNIYGRLCLHLFEKDRKKSSRRRGGGDFVWFLSLDRAGRLYFYPERPADPGSGAFAGTYPSAQGETLEEAAMVHGLDVDLLVDQINDYLAQ